MRSLLREGRAMKEGNELTWAQVVMAANAPVMTKAALVEGRTDVGVLPTGQVVGVIESLPTVADIVAGIMAEADAVLRRWSASASGASPPFAAAAARVALGHAAQQVRDPLVRHPEEMGDARDALALGAQRHDQRAAQVPAGLGLAAQDRAHQLHRARLVLVAEDRLPLPPVLPGQADLGDALGQQALALGVLPQDRLQLVEGVQHLVGPGPARSSFWSGIAFSAPLRCSSAGAARSHQWPTCIGSSNRRAVSRPTPTSGRLTRSPA